MDPKQEAYNRVQAYLYKHKTRLAAMSVDYIASDIRTFVLDTSLLTDSELRGTIAVWRSLNGPVYSLPNPSYALPADSKLIESVKKGMTVLVDGVDITRGDGKVNISVSGVTAELQRGAGRAAVSLGWGGSLGLEAEAGDFHFSGEISSERWEVKLSYPQDTAIPDLSMLGNVFGEAEGAMRDIVGATASFRNLQDIPRVKDAITPHLQPVKDAVEAVKGIAKAKPNAVSVGLSVGSAPPMPWEVGTMPRGVQGQLTLTITF